ncbi:MAG: glutamine synthetase family protein [candidate division WOR-3 bacterium]
MLEILNRIREEKIYFIDLWFSDILGSVKNLTIPASEMAKVLEEGIWFDGSSIEGFGRISESDMYLRPDPETFAILPNSEVKTARLICDVFAPNYEPFVGDPRYILKEMTKSARRLGYEYMVGAELEFYLFRPEKGLNFPQDQVGYFDLLGDSGLELRREISNQLSFLDIEAEAGHHEVGPGQQEIDLKYTEALKMADNLITAKVIIKKVAQEKGLYATFMPKPLFGKPGSGLHLHQSLFSKGENIFAEPKDTYGLSTIAYQFLAGELKYVKEISAVLSPIVNSYKRLVSGFEAPVYICWGQMNRSALIRVPKISPKKVLNTRIELRSPDASCNPYLAFAVMLKAGLEGIEQKLTPPPPVEENVYNWEGISQKRELDTLPRSLFEALEYFSQSKLARETLGEYLFQKYQEIKMREWQEYCLQVSPWELEKYLQLY